MKNKKRIKTIWTIRNKSGKENYKTDQVESKKVDINPNKCVCTSIYYIQYICIQNMYNTVYNICACTQVFLKIF